MGTLSSPLTFKPQHQAKFFPVEQTAFDGSDGAQTVQVAPKHKVNRDVLRAWDIDPGVSDWEAERAGRLPRSSSFVNPPLLCSRIPRGVVTTSAGIVLTDDGRWLVESVGKPRFAERVVEMAPWGRIVVDEPQRSLDEDAAVVFSVFTPKKTRNYYHWIVEGLTRAAMLGPAGIPETVRILVPAPVVDLHRESLEAIGIDPERILEWTGEPTRFRTVYLPSAPQHRADEPVATAISFLREQAARFRSGPPTRRLWVSRRLARRRPMGNEQELVDVALDFGFEEVLAETMTVGEQVELFAQAEAIVGPHGAGLTNAVFMAPGTKIGEAAPELLKPRQKSFFWNLAAAGDQGYAYCVGPAVGIDPRRFERVLGELLN